MLHEAAYLEACEAANVSALNTLVKAGFEITSERFEMAARYADKRNEFQNRVFQCFVDALNITPEMCAEVGSTRGLIEMHKIGHPMTFEVCKRAIEHGHVDCLRYAVNNLEESGARDRVFLRAQAVLDEHKKSLPDAVSKEIADALMKGYLGN